MFQLAGSQDAYDRFSAAPDGPLTALAVPSSASARPWKLAFEQHAPGATIHNFGDALWWSIVTALARITSPDTDQALRCIR